MVSLPYGKNDIRLEVDVHHTSSADPGKGVVEVHRVRLSFWRQKNCVGIGRKILQNGSKVKA